MIQLDFTQFTAIYESIQKDTSYSLSSQDIRILQATDGKTDLIIILNKMARPESKSQWTHWRRMIIDRYGSIWIRDYYKFKGGSTSNQCAQEAIDDLCAKNNITYYE